MKISKCTPPHFMCAANAMSENGRGYGLRTINFHALSHLYCVFFVCLLHIQTFIHIFFRQVKTIPTNCFLFHNSFRFGCCCGACFTKYMRFRGDHVHTAYMRPRNMHVCRLRRAKIMCITYLTLNPPHDDRRQQFRMFNNERSNATLPHCDASLFDSIKFTKKEI